MDEKCCFALWRTQLRALDEESSCFGQCVAQVGFLEGLKDPLERIRERPVE